MGLRDLLRFLNLLAAVDPFRDKAEQNKINLIRTTIKKMMFLMAPILHYTPLKHLQQLHLPQFKESHFFCNAALTVHKTFMIPFSSAVASHKYGCELHCDQAAEPGLITYSKSDCKPRKLPAACTRATEQ